MKITKNVSTRQTEPKRKYSPDAPIASNSLGLALGKPWAPRASLDKSWACLGYDEAHFFSWDLVDVGFPTCFSQSLKFIHET
jgi:hypothetical protein